MKTLGDLPVRVKLTAMLAATALGLLGCAAIGIFATKKLADAAREVQEWDVERLGLWSAIDAAMLQARRREKDFLLRAVRTDEFYSTGKSPFLDLHAKNIQTLRQRAGEARALYARFAPERVNFDEFS